MQDNYTSNSHKRTNERCSLCGQQIKNSKQFHSEFDPRSGIDGPDVPESYSSHPVRAATLQSEVLVPLARSLISGILVPFPVVVLSFWADFSWYPALAVSSCSVVVFWISYLGMVENMILSIRSISFSKSHNAVGREVGRKKSEPIALDVTEKTSYHTKTVRFIDLPAQVSDEDFEEFCKQVLAGKTFARKNWVGPGKMFSRDTYDQLIGALLLAGIIAPLHSGGKTMTNGGKKAVSRMLLESGKGGETA